MIHSVIVKLIISLQIIQMISGYDFTYDACKSTQGQQSPINLVTTESKFYDEKYFRFLSNNYDVLTEENKWSYFDAERAIGVGPAVNQTNLGSFVFVKDWAMYSFNLEKILFRTRSEHQLEGKYFDVEMQYIHSIDPSYYPPGRRVNLGVNYLVISILFARTDDLNPARSKLFDFMNLEGFAKGTSSNMSRDIKFHEIIQHQPAFLYEGTLSYPECQPALWLVNSQYHSISNSDLKLLTDSIKRRTTYLDLLTSSNTRNIFAKQPNLYIYRNWKETEKMTPRPTLMAYNSSHYLNLTFMSAIGLIFMLIIIMF